MCSFFFIFFYLSFTWIENPMIMRARDSFEAFSCGLSFLLWISILSLSILTFVHCKIPIAFFGNPRRHVRGIHASCIFHENDPVKRKIKKKEVIWVLHISRRKKKRGMYTYVAAAAVSYSNAMLHHHIYSFFKIREVCKYKGEKEKNSSLLYYQNYNHELSDTFVL